MPDRGRFATTGRAEIAAIVVTFGSAAHLETLLAGLRQQARDVALRVIVADNSPDDTTLRVAQAHPDVLALPTGGNLGYAGGINCALEHIGDAEAVLILNPDLRVHPGALRTMLGRLREDPRHGAVVPRIVDERGELGEPPHGIGRQRCEGLGMLGEGLRVLRQPIRECGGGRGVGRRSVERRLEALRRRAQGEHLADGERAAHAEPDDTEHDERGKTDRHATHDPAP